MQTAEAIGEQSAQTPYNALVIDHFTNPRSVAPGPAQAHGSETAGVEACGTEARCGEGGSVESGVWIEFQLHIEQMCIQRAFFRAYGCPHTVALASWLTERLVGEKLSKDYALDHAEISAMLDLPTEKMRSALVAEDALRACAAHLNA